MLAMRALVFYFFYALSLIIYAVPCLLIGPFLPFRRRFNFFLVWSKFVLWLLQLICNVRHEITGLDNVPPGTFMVMSNHQSPWETIFLYLHFRPACAILKRELLRIPFFGWGLRLLRPIAIDRSNRSLARKLVLEQGRKRFAEGLNILVFPEGTRVDPGKRKKFSVGGTELAIASGASILPVAHNAGHHWPSRKLVKYPGTIRVVIGKPLETSGRDPRELTEEVQTWIYSQLDKMESRHII